MLVVMTIAVIFVMIVILIKSLPCLKLYSDICY